MVEEDYSTNIYPKKLIKCPDELNHLKKRNKIHHWLVRITPPEISEKCYAY